LIFGGDRLIHSLAGLMDKTKEETYGDHSFSDAES
jgi:hypothetical protein